MIWCEHCRDHYEQDHYEDGEFGGHKVGLDYGPVGQDMLIRKEVALVFVRQPELQHDPHFEDLYRAVKGKHQ